MSTNIFKIVLKSISFYRKPVLYQVIIIALLSAVITGSLLTGRSVRESLKKTASERLGNTGILISSGLRYFDALVEGRIEDSIGVACTGFLEITGNSQSLNSQKGAFSTKIYGVSKNFFRFHGIDSLLINKGEVIINRRLADQLEVREGEDIIIRFNSISDIPADAPFAPAAEEGKSIVMRIAKIIGSEKNGNFSLSISQITPMNIFVNLSDLQTDTGKVIKINRLIVDKKSKYSSDDVTAILEKLLMPADVGLRVRKIKRTGEAELISDRIFIDDAIIKEIGEKLPSSAPVITYLANKIKAGSRSTPYSFVSALPSSIYPEIVSNNYIIINRWLADDLAIGPGDSLTMYWYSPDLLNKLVEDSSRFVVKKVVDMKGIWSDSLLMPEFPGISGRESCSDWDAGVPVKVSEIRDKDEDYWNKFKGTPKAFIGYEKGKELWGSNFGPATSIRFGAGLSVPETESGLKGSIDPFLTGFTVTDIYGESIRAADQSIDFGTLFLSLGFFLVLASIVLLSFVVSYYFDSKRGTINTLFALGFKNDWINKLLLLESVFISLAGCFLGALSGYLVNIIITGALNSVWRGAVQTNTLDSYFDFIPILEGFAITTILVTLFMLIKTKIYLQRLSRKEKMLLRSVAKGRNLIFLVISFLITISLYILSIKYNDQELALNFASGTMLLVTFILFWKQFYMRSGSKIADSFKHKNRLSHLYYSFNPGHAVTPILFIATGIFAVFITSVNRMDFNEKFLKRQAGTGGYLLWCESNLPVKENLNTKSGRKILGIDDDSLSAMSFTEIKRYSGNDASCLNLNHITSPPLLGIDPADFIARDAFSFAKVLNVEKTKNPWQYLKIDPGANTVYGIADQTVLDWGLKLSVGDTLILRSESGQPLNIILAAGLKSSVFQGYVIIGKENFTKYFPSVSGSSVLLVDGEPDLTDLYKTSLNDRFVNYGINIERTTDRLASFYEVTNTYLSVFGVFGALGMITGIAGLGFVILRNYNSRKREFALMLATGFTYKRIRRIIISEQILILFAGVSSGVISAIFATLTSVKAGQDIPWLFLFMMIMGITLSGLTAILLSVKSIRGDSLIASLKKE
jgi:putative ABC transport system permease protein